MRRSNRTNRLADKLRRYLFLPATWSVLLSEFPPPKAACISSFRIMDALYATLT